MIYSIYFSALFLLEISVSDAVKICALFMFIEINLDNA